LSTTCLAHDRDRIVQGVGDVCNFHFLLRKHENHDMLFCKGLLGNKQVGATKVWLFFRISTSGNRNIVGSGLSTIPKNMWKTESRKLLTRCSFRKLSKSGHFFSWKKSQHRVHQKMCNVSFISKMQTYLSDKMTKSYSRKAEISRYLIIFQAKM
jgi:hypothetical protein